MADEKPTTPKKPRRRQTSRSTRKRSTKPTTRRDNATELDNENDPLAGDMHEHLRTAPEGAVDFYDDPPDAAKE